MSKLPAWINWLLAISAIGGVGWMLAISLNPLAQPSNNANNSTDNSQDEKKLTCSSKDYQTESMRSFQGSIKDLAKAHLILPSQPMVQLDRESYVKLGRAVAWENCNANGFLTAAAIRDPKSANLLLNINNPLCTLWSNQVDSPNLTGTQYGFLYSDPNVPGQTKSKTYSAMATLKGLTCLEALSIPRAVGAVFTPNMMIGLNQNSVSDLNITTIPELENLIALDIGNLYIGDLQPLSKLSNLEYLYMQGVSTKEISQFGLFKYAPRPQLTRHLSNLTKLKVLDLSESKAGNLTHLSGLTNLQYLSVARTYTQTLDGIQDLTNLQGLDASGIKISSLMPLTNLSKLVYLNIANTEIKFLNALSKLRSLSELNLSGLTTAFTQDVFANNATILLNLKALRKITVIGALSKANCQELQSVLPGKQVSC